MHPYYGFGAVDAAAALALAKGWTVLAPERREDGVAAADANATHAVPDDGTPLLMHWRVTPRPATAPALLVETAEVVFDASHPCRGDLRVVLTSPSGTRSVLAAPVTAASVPAVPRVYTSVAFRDEIATGAWSLTVQDTHPTHVGEVRMARLALYGRDAASGAIAPSSKPRECDALRATFASAQCCAPWT